MPPPSYEQKRIVSLQEAWDLLSDDESWEIAERYTGGRLLVGRPRIRPQPQVGAVGVAMTSPNAKAHHHGIETETPGAPAGARWVGTAQEAFDAFHDRIAHYAGMTAGEERLFRVKMFVNGVVEDEALVAVGEISSDPEVLTGLSLTYLGVLAGIALAFAFGLQELGWLCRIAIGVGIFIGLALLLRTARVRRYVTRFSRWALRGSDDEN